MTAGGKVRPQHRDHVLDLLSPLGEVEARRYFGGLGLRLGGVQFAALFSGALYLTCDGALRSRLEALGGAAFSYETRRGRVEVPRLTRVPDALLDDQELLCELARRALRASSTPRTPRRRGGKGPQ